MDAFWGLEVDEIDIDGILGSLVPGSEDQRRDYSDHSSLQSEMPGDPLASLF